MRKYWLMKSEPSVYSIDDLARDGVTRWDGVRNYQARNFMRDEMAVGDLVLFYHSSADPSGVAGIAKVSSKSYPDRSQFDRKSKYYDGDSKQDDPRWWLVDLAFVEAIEPLVTLADIKADPELADMLVARKGQRLSVQPVDSAHFKRIVAKSKAKTKVR